MYLLLEYILNFELVLLNFVCLQNLYEKVTAALEAVALFPALIVMSQLILFGSLRLDFIVFLDLKFNSHANLILVRISSEDHVILHDSISTVFQTLNFSKSTMQELMSL